MLFYSHCYYDIESLNRHHWQIPIVPALQYRRGARWDLAFLFGYVYTDNQRNELIQGVLTGKGRSGGGSLIYVLKQQGTALYILQIVCCKHRGKDFKVKTRRTIFNGSDSGSSVMPHETKRITFRRLKSRQWTRYKGSQGIFTKKEALLTQRKAGTLWGLKKQNKCGRYFE